MTKPDIERKRNLVATSFTDEERQQLERIAKLMHCSLSQVLLQAFHAFAAKVPANTDPTTLYAILAPKAKRKSSAKGK